MKKKQKILNSIILFLLLSNYGYAQKFDYSKLKSHPIKFMNHELSLMKAKNAYDILPAFGMAKTVHKSNLIDIKINESPPIFHVCNDSIQENQVNNQTEYLLYINNKINLDSLFINAINSSVKYQTYVKFEDYYTFTFNNREFAVFRVTERRFFNNVLYYHLILLEIKNDKVAKSFAFIDCPEITLNCFGDFNFDGNLDFIDWRKKETKINLYSLRGNKFVKEKQYIKVRPTKNEQNYERHYDDLFNYSLIDKKNSKWFYSF
ncbi:hypothetical protein [Flavobacterium chilense]|uniref:Uncharacterized protein n=1 Tax=Flavobacterium chilense TaxID=946677 RepID=A0A1M6Y5U1_9FLAO|nr:hypothetical protein [Flavobacterium chilense]SHL13597.1 hypothetical protein SAMN05444484_101429 [Flavobacterium chilense]